MPLDQATIEAQLLLVQTAITNALASPTANWRVGQVEFNQTDYLKHLIALQKELIELLRMEPSEDISTAQNYVGALGHDASEYLGEPV